MEVVTVERFKRCKPLKRRFFLGHCAHVNRIKKLKSMAAKNNNQFWKHRSKHGRKKIFETPKILLDACYEYFEHQINQKWERVDFKGNDVQEIKIPTPLPFTLTSLCVFLGVNCNYFNQFEKNLNPDKEIDKEFADVITHVREVIFVQKFEGAAVGAYKANIISRDLGLMEKKEETKKKAVISFR